MIEELPETEPTDDTCHRDLKDERVDESSKEPSKKSRKVVRGSNVHHRSMLVSEPAFHA